MKHFPLSFLAFGICLGLILSIWLVPLAPAAPAPSPNPIVGAYDYPMTELGFQRITDLSSAESFTVPTGTQMIFLQAEDGSIRVSASNTPTSTVGILIDNGGDLWLPLKSMSLLKAIQVDAGAKVSATFFGW